MRRTIQIAGLISVAYIAGRLLLVHWRSITSPFWALSSIFPLIFLFAMTEISWSRSAFYGLEGVIVSLLDSRQGPAVQRWSRKRIEWMYNLKRSVVTALFAIPLVITVHQAIGWNAWLSDRYLYMYDSVWQILMLSASAGSQWPFANISFFVTRLPRKGLSINFYAHPKDSIMSLASLLLKIDLGGVLLTFLLATALFISPVRIPAPVYALLITVFLWAGAWFFLTQYTIHRCMLNEKRAKHKLVSERLMEVLRLVAASPNSENQKSFEDLKHVYDAVDALPEWPFRIQTVLTLTSGVLVPIAITIIDLIMKR